MTIALAARAPVAATSAGCAGSARLFCVSGRRTADL